MSLRFVVEGADRPREVWRSRWPVFSVVALLHLCLLILLWRAHADRRQDTLPLPGSTMRLIPDRSAPTAPAVRSEAQPPPPSSAQLPPPSSFVLQIDVDALLNGTSPAHGAPAESTGAASDRPQSYGRVGLDGSAAAPSPGASGPQGLAVVPSREVLRGSLANPAVMDPRSNSPRPSMEERIALSLNPELCLKEERMPDGTIRRYLAKRKEMPTAAQALTSQKTARILACQ